MVYAVIDTNIFVSALITQEGKPILLIRNLDGSTNKLLTDEELKKYQVMDDGTVIKTT